MNKYIGTKLVEAEPAYRLNGIIYHPDSPELIAAGMAAEEGYRVKYPDGYESWSPKEVFEKAYFKVDDNKELPSGVSVGPDMVTEFISSTQTFTIEPCTTVVHCKLRNGFSITEASSCVDPVNYSQEMGEKICMERIRNKIWNHLGFLLQTAWHGIR